ncbi:MAG: tautomerase family protein [Steroidobacteraceae bacterium]|jgi:4-oxalocrotonate tautomerase
MPFVRVSVARETSDEDLKLISDAIHESMVATFNVPEKDRFQVLTRHASNEISCAPEYLGITHSGPLVLIQITCNEGRTLEMKKALFTQLASSIAARTAVAAADVIVSLVEVKKENWSFGNGIAQYAS